MLTIEANKLPSVGAIENLCANCLSVHPSHTEARVCAHTGAVEREMLNDLVYAECVCGGAVLRSNTQGIFPIGKLSWQEENPCGLKLLLKCIVQKCYLRQGCEFAFSERLEIATIEEAVTHGWLPRDPFAFIRLAEPNFVREFQRVLYLLEEDKLHIVDTSWAA